MIWFKCSSCVRCLVIVKDCPSECASGGERKRVACIVGKVAKGLVEHGLGPFLARVGGW